MSSDPVRPAKRAGRPKAGEPQLTREGILATALDLVDEHGLEALSMRRLARELDTDPMSLYRHLPNKAAIVSGLVNAVFAEMRRPETPDGTWDEHVRTWARAYLDLARAHPNLVLQIVTDAVVVSEAAILINEPLYAALESAGLPPATVIQASGMLVDFVNGFALGEAGIGTDPTADRDEVAARLAAHAPDRLPTMRRVHAAASVTVTTACPAPPPTPAEYFDASIDIMINGLRALGARSTGPRA